MPLYEYFCDNCEASFEALVALSASEQDSYACPECSAGSRRILSAVNFANERRAPAMPADRDRHGQPDVTSLRLPPVARLCWMDDRSASRLAAYKAGRGAEYDDTVAARKELALKRGETESSMPASDHSHSPLSNPTILANRAKAAQEEKVAASATLLKNNDKKP